MKTLVKMLEGSAVSKHQQFFETGQLDFLSLSTKYKPVRNCSIEMDTTLHAGGHEPGLKPGSKKRTSTWAEGFAEELNIPIPQDETFFKILDFLQKRENIVIKDYGNQNIKVFPESRRGNANYQKKMGAKIKDALFFGTKILPETMFLTITCDPNQHGQNRIKAWASFPKEVGKVCKEMKRKFHAEYVEVKESTLNGFPHAHIMLMFPAGTVKGYDKMKNGGKIRFGAIANTVKQFRTAKIFDLKCVKGKNVIHYMAKYISKGFDETKKPNLTKGGQITDDIKKMLFALVLSVKTGKRLFNMSRMLSDKIKENQMLYAMGLVEEKTISKVDKDGTIRGITIQNPEKIYEMADWETIVRGKMKSLPDKKLFNAPRRFKEFAEDILRDRISDCLQLAENVLEIWNDPFPDELHAGLARLYLIQICNNLPDCTKANRFEIPYNVVKTNMGLRKEVCLKYPAELVEKNEDFMQPAGCRGCFLKDLVSLIRGTFPGIFATAEQLEELSKMDDLSWFFSVRTYINTAIKDINLLNINGRIERRKVKANRGEMTTMEKRQRSMGQTFENQAFRFYRKKMFDKSREERTRLTQQTEINFPDSIKDRKKRFEEAKLSREERLARQGITREMIDKII